MAKLKNFPEYLIYTFNLKYDDLLVMQFLMLGLSNKQIAETIKITESAVKARLTKVYKSIGVTKRSDAIKMIYFLRLENGYSDDLIKASESEQKESKQAQLPPQILPFLKHL